MGLSCTYFNLGLAGKIFADIITEGAKVVMKNSFAESVLIAPDEYVALVDELTSNELVSLL